MPSFSIRNFGLKLLSIFIATLLWLVVAGDTVLVEGNHYFPESALNRAFVTFSNHRTTCPWKGEAKYLSLLVNGEINADAAWYYPDPKPEAENIRGRVAFWKGVKIEA